MTANREGHEMTEEVTPKRYWTRRKIAFWCAVVVLTVVIGCAMVVREHIRRPRGPYVHTPAVVQPLERVAYRVEHLTEDAPGWSHQLLGTVTYGEFEAPLWLLRYTPESVTRRVLLTGGVHGNEPMGAESVMRFAELLRRSPEAFPGTAFDIIPVVNPWGYEHDRRYNQQGFDINRDFGPFQTQEARIIRDFMADKQYDLAIDHHEDSSAQGFYLYDVATPHEDLCRAIIDAVRKQGHAIAQDVWMVIFKTKDGLIDAPLWSLYAAQYALGNSLINYVRLHHAANTFLLETPSDWKPRERLETQALARELLLEGL